MGAGTLSPSFGSASEAGEAYDAKVDVTTVDNLHKLQLVDEKRSIYSSSSHLRTLMNRFACSEYHHLPHNTPLIASMHLTAAAFIVSACAFMFTSQRPYIWVQVRHSSRRAGEVEQGHRLMPG